LGGTGAAGFLNGAGNVAKFNYPRGVVSNIAGDKIYVVDYNNHAIRMITESSAKVEELGLREEIALYPNPAKDIVSIDLRDAKDKIFQVFDLQGREVTKNVAVLQSKNDHTLQLNIEKLARGVYIIRFNNSDRGRIVKE
jgi:DNA-binding beta-propeller fold protein YncE